MNIEAKTLVETLEQIAADFGLDASELVRYADADKIGGYHTDADLSTYPIGSIWGVEGQILYALVCATQPKQILELGAFMGCSRAHMEAATYVNKVGEITSVDLKHDADVMGDGVEYLRKSRKKWDFIFEDMLHRMDETRDAWKYGIAKLRHGGFIVSHDALHHIVGVDVRAGIEANGIQPKYYLTKPSDCGLAIWRKPQEPKKPARKRAKKTEVKTKVKPFNVEEK